MLTKQINAYVPSTHSRKEESDIITYSQRHNGLYRTSLKSRLYARRAPSRLHLHHHPAFGNNGIGTTFTQFKLSWFAIDSQLFKYNRVLTMPAQCEIKKREFGFLNFILRHLLGKHSNLGLLQLLRGSRKTRLLPNRYLPAGWWHCSGVSAAVLISTKSKQMLKSFHMQFLLLFEALSECFNSCSKQYTNKDHLGCNITLIFQALARFFQSQANPHIH